MAFGSPARTRGKFAITEILVNPPLGQTQARQEPRPGSFITAPGPLLPRVPGDSPARLANGDGGEQGRKEHSFSEQPLWAAGHDGQPSVTLCQTASTNKRLISAFIDCIDF